MKTLEEAGLIEKRRSLDASPRSRKARYRVRDGALAFWFTVLLPVRERLLAGEPPREVWQTSVRPRVRHFVASRIDHLVRTELTLEPLLGIRSRQVGSIWGEDVELPVSGILESGAAFYGRSWWELRPPNQTLEEMYQQIRETRFGYGRESRLRLLFVRMDPDHDWERRVARADNARFLGPATLIGRS